MRRELYARPPCAETSRCTRATMPRPAPCSKKDMAEFGRLGLTWEQSEAMAGFATCTGYPATMPTLGSGWSESLALRERLGDVVGRAWVCRESACWPDMRANTDTPRPATPRASPSLTRSATTPVPRSPVLDG